MLFDKHGDSDVNSSLWNKLSVGDLHDQLSVLNDRLAFAAEINHTEMYNQLAKGIKSLEALIHVRQQQQQSATKDK